jgi:hypothetical protein
VAETRTHYADHSVSLVSAGDFMLTGWFDTGNMEQLLRVNRETLAIAQERGRVVQFTLVQINAFPRLDDAMRKEVGAQFQRMIPHIIAGVTVMVASGFANSIIRSIIASLMVIERPPYPHSVQNDVESGLQWIAPHVPAKGGKRPTIAELRSAVEAMVAARKPASPAPGGRP